MNPSPSPSDDRTPQTVVRKSDGMMYFALPQKPAGNQTVKVNGASVTAPVGYWTLSNGAELLTCTPEHFDASFRPVTQDDLSVAREKRQLAAAGKRHLEMLTLLHRLVSMADPRNTSEEVVAARAFLASVAGPSEPQTEKGAGK